MANASRKCPYDENYNRMDDHGVFFDSQRNRLFCNWHCRHEYVTKGSLKVQERKALKHLESIKSGSKPAVPLKDKSLRHHWEITRAVAQKAARLRDAYHNRPCITCGKHHKSYDGGHYKSAKAHPELQLNLKNINAECKNDNWWNDNHISEMRIGIIERYGQDRLDWLDKHHEMNPDHRDKEYLARYRKVINRFMKRWMK